MVRGNMQEVRLTIKEMTYNRINYDIPELTSLQSKAMDLDVTEAITDLKMLEFAHNASLSTTARMLNSSLLNFIK